MVEEISEIKKVYKIWNREFSKFIITKLDKWKNQTKQKVGSDKILEKLIKKKAKPKGDVQVWFIIKSKIDKNSVTLRGKGSFVVFNIRR